ncbi:hypothetical protein V499_00006 [Pseudogymnoascus sp. VKM F-103]|nr:hypothetical protein V499_00006 [Pseudogymnoascus sp. VKM F-103]
MRTADIADGDTAPRSAERTAGGDEHLGLPHDPYEYSATEYSIHGVAVPRQEWAEGGERNGTVTESGKGGAWDLLLHQSGRDRGGGVSTYPGLFHVAVENKK